MDRNWRTYSSKRGNIMFNETKTTSSVSRLSGRSSFDSENYNRQSTQSDSSQLFQWKERNAREIRRKIVRQLRSDVYLDSLEERYRIDNVTSVVLDSALYDARCLYSASKIVKNFIRITDTNELVLNDAQFADITLDKLMESNRRREEEINQRRIWNSAMMYRRQKLQNLPAIQPSKLKRIREAPAQVSKERLKKIISPLKKREIPESAPNVHSIATTDWVEEDWEIPSGWRYVDNMFSAAADELAGVFSCPNLWLKQIDDKTADFLHFDETTSGTKLPNIENKHNRSVVESENLKRSHNSPTPMK